MSAKYLNDTGLSYLWGKIKEKLVGVRNAETHSEIFNDYENNEASGEYSHVEGKNSTSVMGVSHVEGNNMTALGEFAHAEGYSSVSVYEKYPEWTRDTEKNTVLAEWEQQKFALAKGSPSHVEGENCVALENGSHAEGTRTIAGWEAHSEGQETKALGPQSHAEGKNNETLAPQSHVEGLNNFVSETAYASHVEGSSNTMSGQLSHIEGGQNSCDNDYCHVSGQGNETSSNYQTMVGRYCEPENNIMFAVGNGTSNEQRSNAFQVKYDGSAEVGKQGTQPYSVLTKKHFDDNAVGKKIAISGSWGEVFNTAKTAGYKAHAEGSSTSAIAEMSHAEGLNTTTHGKVSHTEGELSVTGDSANSNKSDYASDGRYVPEVGYAAHSEGKRTLAKGNYSHSGGLGSKAIKDYSFVHGNGVESTRDAQAVVGQFNDKDSNALFVVGNGTREDYTNADGTVEKFRSNAFEVFEDGSAVLQAQGGSDNSVALKSYVDSKIPIVTEDDNGKLLQVVNGAWVAVQNSKDGGGVSSYNDLTDKPFYTKEVWNELIPETALPFTLNGGTSGFMTTPTTEMFEIYNSEWDKALVLWDGVEYECESKLYMGALKAIGNVEFANGTGDSGEPFILLVDDGTITGYEPTSVIISVEDTKNQTATATHTIGISFLTEEIHPLDSKYLEIVNYQKGALLLAEQELAFNDINGEYVSQFDAIDIVSGKEYKVLWDGEEYVYEAKEITIGDSSIVVIGDNSINSLFAILVQGENTMIITSSTSSTHTVGITQLGSCKIKQEYIPDSLYTEIDSRIESYINEALGGEY